MRVSTALMHQRGLGQLQLAQQALLKTQTQLATQNRVSRAGEDPLAWAGIAAQDQTLSETGRQLANAQHLRHRLGMQEQALSDAGALISRVRELAVQGSNGTQSAETRAVIATELRGLREALLAIANRDDGQGQFLFGGTRDAQAPFSWDGHAASYHGDSQVRSLPIGGGRLLAEGEAGDAVFTRHGTGDGRISAAIPTGNAGGLALRQLTSAPDAVLPEAPWTAEVNGGVLSVRDAQNQLLYSQTYTPGTTVTVGPLRLTLEGAAADGDRVEIDHAAPRDLFGLVEDLARWLEAPQGSLPERARAQTGLVQSLEALSGAEGQLLARRTGVGLKLEAAEQAMASLEGQRLTAEVRRSELADVDIAEAASRLQRELTALQAAQLAYTRVQGLSLFDFLR